MKEVEGSVVTISHQIQNIKKYNNRFELAEERARILENKSVEIT